MTKRQIIKIIKSEYKTEKRSDRSHDIILYLNKKKYYLKVVNISSNVLLSINSKFVWEVKKGKISGIRFIKYSSTLIDLKSFIKKENKIVVLTNRPYKILKQLNESDIIDVSTKDYVHNIFITSNPLSIREIE
ncbi:MAG: hypothetical protein KAJ22_04455 [Candidatus Izimaplasma sp.]|nr:hypothetical protein [Candidatus Izimaplasma bacterium]